MAGALVNNREDQTPRHTEGRRPWDDEAETGLRQLSIQGPKGRAATVRSQEEARRASPQILRGSVACYHLELRRPAPRTPREHISVVVSHYSSPGQLIHGLSLSFLTYNSGIITL